MLREVAQALDQWITEQNVAAQAGGLPLLASCEIRVFGQTALMEAGLALTLATTQDVDVRANYVHAVEKEFERLLQRQGRILDPVAHEAWMPRETRYSVLYRGSGVVMLLAEVEAILVSKAHKAPHKNAALLCEYLAKAPSERFFELVEKYSVDLERFL